MQSVTIEKGQHLTLTVVDVESVPSKNPTWDSRWKIIGVAHGGVDASTYLGNKAVMQQLSRMGKQSPEDLRNGQWTFERTVEGYLNIIAANGKTKTPHVPMPGAASPAPVASPSPAAKPLPFDEPVEAGFYDDTPVDKSTQLRDEKRKRVADDIAWAIGIADNYIAQIAASRNIEYGPELMRSTAALAATIHISYKDAR